MQKEPRFSLINLVKFQNYIPSSNVTKCVKCVLLKHTLQNK